jgi:ABC-type spermidine/putrescine transport system permease subunit I
VPIAFPGILAGAMLVFIPAVGEFVIPDLLGGSDTLMIGRILWTEFFENRDWPAASAVAIVLLAGLMFLLWQQLLPIVAPLVFTAYLIYGFVRPFISRKMQKEIEHDDDEEGTVP